MRLCNGLGRVRLRSIAALVAGAALLAIATRGRAEPPTIAPEAVQWTVTANFEKNTNDDLADQPRSNLSGAACVPTTPKFTSCLIANDEKKYAQFFSIDGTAISPRKLIRLSDDDKDPDAEAVAYADGYFYVAGSHGRSRKSDKANDSSYVVFRFPVDPATGAPPFAVTEDRVEGVDVSTRLRKALRTGAGIKDHYDKPLARGGVNIEGIAVQAGRMHLGLRGPSSGGRAFVLSVDAAAVFTGKAGLNSAVTRLKLGRHAGIRDLAAVSDGILVLAGPTRSEAVPYAIWRWDGVGNTIKLLATLDLGAIDRNGKAEVLLPLAETPSDYRVLVMFDGIENGGPVSFRVPR